MIKAKTERLENAKMLDLKMEEGVMTQGMKATFLEARKCKEMDFPLEQGSLTPGVWTGTSLRPVRN